MLAWWFPCRTSRSKHPSEWFPGRRRFGTGSAGKRPRSAESAPRAARRSVRTRPTSCREEALLDEERGAPDRNIFPFGAGLVRAREGARPTQLCPRPESCGGNSPRADSTRHFRRPSIAPIIPKPRSMSLLFRPALSKRHVACRCAHILRRRRRPVQNLPSDCCARDSAGAAAGKRARHFLLVVPTPRARPALPHRACATKAGESINNMARRASQYVAALETSPLSMS